MTSVPPGGGLPTARVFLVGEAWGEAEERSGIPFVGASGQLLDNLLREAGLSRSECYVSNLVNARPPYNDLERWIPKKVEDRKAAAREGWPTLRGKVVHPLVQAGFESLLREIDLVKPRVIVALGGWALWALTGATGILKWRGSQIWTQDAGPRVKLIPTVHPAAVLREMSLRPTVVVDLKRAARERDTPPERYSNEPEWNFIIRPSFAEAISVIEGLYARLSSGETLWLDFDLETKAGHIDCAGISWSRTEALCLPLMSATNKEGYWSAEEESALVYALYKVLTHPRALVRGQNLLYDAQYTYRWWHFVPRVAQDTMIAFHSCFAGQRKSLDFQASLFCDYYTQWKPDKQAWKEGG